MKSKLRRFLLKRSILDLNSALESYEVDLSPKKNLNRFELFTPTNEPNHISEPPGPPKGVYFTTKGLIDRSNTRNGHGIGLLGCLRDS